VNRCLPWLRHLAALWLWLFVAVFLSPTTYAYDFQSRPSDAYNGTIGLFTIYDGPAVHIGNERGNWPTWHRVLFATSAEFLVAKVEGTELVKEGIEAANGASSLEKRAKELHGLLDP